jgi:cytidylate kinase
MLLFAPFAEWSTLAQQRVWVPMILHVSVSWAASRSESYLVYARCDPFTLALTHTLALAIVLFFSAAVWIEGSPFATLVVAATCYRALFPQTMDAPVAAVGAKKPTIVGISGKIGSGKSTLSAALRAATGARGVEINFADALKREVADLYNIAAERCYNQNEKNKPISDSVKTTIGEALQTVANKRRENNPDYWLNKVSALIDADTQHSLFIVADVRFANEADWVRKRGGILVRLNGDPGAVRRNSKRDLAHTSETSLDNYDGFDFVWDTEKSDAASIAQSILKSLAFS